MPELCFHLADLSPTEALHVLAIAAEKTGGRHIDKLTLHVHDSRFGPQVTILVPNAGPQRQRHQDHRARQRSFDAVINAYKKVMAPRVPRRGPISAAVIPLARGVAWLLFISGSTEEELAPENVQEYLLMGREIDDVGRAREILADLRFHATHTRIAAAEPETDATLYFFHVLDDHQRRSTFLSAIAEGAFPECNLLTCFTSLDLAVFLPPENAPGRRGLAHFCRLLRAAPAAFGITGVEVKRGPLAAIDRWPSATSPLAFLPLAGLRFYGQIGYTPWKANPADFEVYDLSDSKSAHNRLKMEIEREDPSAGYRLALRPVKYCEPAEEEQKRLREQQLEIEYRLAYLDSIEQPRPMLYRFTQRQLPALADVIRSFPGRVIRQGVLKYGFQATDDDAGYHFILVEPQYATMIELDPLASWLNPDEPPMRFWLDPYWARYYYSQGNQCLIFVPQDTALFPPMHDWDAKDMDKYMRGVMEQWSHDHQQVAEIPVNPIYVFDGKTPAHTGLRISVLDQDNLQPLYTRLGWMNDNLDIMEAAKGIEAFVQGMANDVTRRDLARDIQDQARDAEDAFMETAQAFSNQVADHLVDLMDTITQDLDRVTKETGKTITEIEELNRGLHELTVIQTDMSKKSDQAEDLVKSIEKLTRDTPSAIEKLRRTVESTLSETQRSRQELERQVEKEIDKWKNVRDELCLKLSQL